MSDKLEPTFAFPGIGGSLGKCALCGDSFVLELLTGKDIATLHCTALKDNHRLPMHQECADKAQAANGWTELPQGPLRTMFERVAAGREGA